MSQLAAGAALNSRIIEHAQQILEIDNFYLLENDGLIVRKTFGTLALRDRKHITKNRRMGREEMRVNAKEPIFNLDQTSTTLARLRARLK